MEGGGGQIAEVLPTVCQGFAGRKVEVPAILHGWDDQGHGYKCLVHNNLW